MESVRKADVIVMKVGQDYPVTFHYVSSSVDIKATVHHLVSVCVK